MRVTYPRYWPPGWGADPLKGLLVGLALVVGLGPAVHDRPDAPGRRRVRCGAVLRVVPRRRRGRGARRDGGTDWRTAVEVTGPILRLRTFGDEDKSRHYVAVDDGESDVIRAWRVMWARFDGLEQGDVITARLTRNLCCVRWIVAAEDAAAAG